MRRFGLLIIALAIVLTGCSSIPTTSDDSNYSIETLYYHLQAVTDLEARDVLSATEAESQREFYLNEAAIITGETLTEPELADYVFSNSGQTWLRFLNFVNLIWAFASLIIVLSCVWIFVKYIFPFLKQVPLVIYEILLYIACASFIFGGMYVEPNIAQFVALPGVLGLFFLLPFSYGYHVEGSRFGDNKNQKKRERTARPDEILRRNFLIQYVVLTIIWGAIAIAYQSVLIGTLTVIVVMAAVALLYPVPFIVKAMGFSQYQPAATLLVVSFALVMIFFIAKALGIGGLYTTVFEPAVFWIGTDAYFFAVGVLSVRWYHRDKRWRYIRWQVVAVVSGLVAMFMGALWDIPEMQEIAGTYFLIYLLGKYIEMQNWRQHWAWASLGLGIILYVVALLINRYPQFFLFG